jgi:hypothetical protein
VFAYWPPASSHCFAVMRLPRPRRPQGLPAAVLAAILGSLPKTGGSLADHTVLLAGGLGGWVGRWGGGGVRSCICYGRDELAAC